jgi:hypothetical protein
MATRSIQKLGRTTARSKGVQNKTGMTGKQGSSLVGRKSASKASTTSTIPSGKPFQVLGQ